MRWICWKTTLVAMLMLCSPVWADGFITAEKAEEHPDFRYQGEYFGLVTFEGDSELTRIGVQVAARGEGRFSVLLYEGGPPGAGWYEGEGERVELTGRRSGEVLEIEAYRGLRFSSTGGQLIARDESGETRGILGRVVRGSPTMGKQPPDDAIVLFDGSNVDRWRDGAEMTEDGLLVQGARTADSYADKYLHLEFMYGFMPDASGQSRANSGVYIQNRYEVQILDSFAEPATEQGAASLYNEAPPLMNVSYPPLQWQTYDIYFRAPRFNDEGEKTENVRITVYHNGVLVQDDVELEGGTGAGGRREEVPEAHLYLQDHTGPVRFRNVWLVEDATVKPRTWEPDNRPANR